MLSLFRSKRKSLNWVLWVVIVVLGAGMLLLFVSPPTGIRGSVGKGAEVANVDGCTVGVLAFRQRYQQTVQMYRQQLGDNFDNFQKQLRIGDQTLNSLISECAISKEAERLGLGVSKEEVRERVLSLPVFTDPETKQFIGRDRYERILEANNMTWQDFEENVQRDILRAKLAQILTDGIDPSPEEVRQKFAGANQQVKVQYVSLDKENWQTPEPTDEELSKFFEESGNKFQIPEMRSVSYVRIPFEADKVKVTEEQIQARLPEIPSGERVRASHILFRVPPEGDDTEARKKAAEVLKKIRAGADFAEMARQYSDDPSGARGGDLGVFGRGIMVLPFEQVAFTLKEGEISDLVKSPFGIHIIKVTAKPNGPEEGRRLLADSQIRDEEASRVAKERADSVVKRVKAGESLEAVAQAESLPLQQSGLFALGDDLRQVGVRSDFNQQVFALKKGEVMEPYLAETNYVVAQLDAIQAARLPKLEEVRDKVLADYKVVKREQLVQKRADEIYRAAVAEGSLAKVAEEQGLKLTTTDFFKSGATVDDTLKFSQVLHDRTPTMKIGEVSPAITVTGKLIVFEVVDKTPIDEEAFAKQKDQIATQLKEEKKNNFFGAYVQNVVDSLRKAEKIRIDQKLVDDLTS